MPLLRQVRHCGDSGGEIESRHGPDPEETEAKAQEGFGPGRQQEDRPHGQRRDGNCPPVGKSGGDQPRGHEAGGVADLDEEEEGTGRAVADGEFRLDHGQERRQDHPRGEVQVEDRRDEQDGPDRKRKSRHLWPSSTKGGAQYSLIRSMAPELCVSK